MTAVRKYVNDGGVLLVDLTGGSGSFDESIRTSLLFTAFNSATPLAVQPNYPLLQAGHSGMEDLSRFRLRPYAIEKSGRTAGAAQLLQGSGKGSCHFHESGHHLRPAQHSHLGHIGI